MYESGEEEAATLFDRLVSALKEGNDQRDIYLTGKLATWCCWVRVPQPMNARAT